MRLLRMRSSLKHAENVSFGVIQVLCPHSCSITHTTLLVIAIADAHRLSELYTHLHESATISARLLITMMVNDILFYGI